MISYFTFRIKQILRFIQSAGLGILLLLPIAFLFITRLEPLLLFLGPIWTQVIFCSLIFSLHNNRKDYEFLNIVFRKRSWGIQVFEYSFSLFLLNILYVSLVGWHYTILIGLVFIFMLPLYKPQIKNKHLFYSKLSNWIPNYLYEWRTFFRTQFIFSILIYIGGLFAVPFTPITPIIMIIWMFFAIEIYKYEEPNEILQSYRKLEFFKKQKIEKLLVTITLLFIPHIVLFLIFHPMEWIYLTISILFIYLYFLYALFGRYTFNKLNHQISNNIPLIIYCISLIIFPLSIYLILQAWSKTKQEIKRLLA